MTPIVCLSLLHLLHDSYGDDDDDDDDDGGDDRDLRFWGNFNCFCWPRRSTRATRRTCGRPS